jgi:predicted lipid-binding transport protein (Tim44 family)
MTQPDATPSAPRGPQDPDITAAKNPVAAHPFTSAVIGLLVAAAICGTLIVPIYARITPKIGDFPFFYFYLLAYMPAVAIVLWIVTLLQRRVQEPTGAIGSDPEVTG